MIPAPHEIDFLEKQKPEKDLREQPAIEITLPEEEPIEKQEEKREYVYIIDLSGR